MDERFQKKKMAENSGKRSILEGGKRKEIGWRGGDRPRATRSPFEARVSVRLEAL